MKKTIGILLSILMILNVVIPVYANTAGATLSSNVSVGTETVRKVKRGETITLTVSMQDCNAAFKSLGLTLVYDESVFEYVETDASGNANWTCPITGLFMSAYVAKNKNLATAAMNEINYNGVIFTINLNVKDTAVFGEQTISITPVIKNGQTVIPCSATSATVEVVCNHVYSDEWTSNVDGHYKVCTISGCTSKTNEARHEWTHACDTDCNVCGFTREIEHPYDTTKWVTDGTNHWLVCATEGCNETANLAKHTGGTADCKNKAVCDICKESYGELGGHTLTYHVGQSADHSNTGVAEHWICDICHKYFNNAAGTNQIEQEDTVINKIPHSYNAEWSHDTTQHWKECGCGNKAELGDHVYDNACDITCICGYTRTITHSWNAEYLYNEDGHWIECSVCGEKKGTVETHTGGTATCKKLKKCDVCKRDYGKYAEHDYTSKVVDEKYLKTDATCKDFAVYYKSCSVCGEAGTATFNGTVKADHKFDNDCDTTCNAGCGYTRSISHQWKETYSTDENKHWYECENCGEKKDEGNHSGGVASCKDKAVCVVCNKAYGELAPHDMKETVDATYLKAEANCVAKALYYKSCSVCGAASTETFKIGELDSTKHTGETEIKDAVKETCTVDGYSGDIYCKDCGMKIEEGDNIAAGHDYGTTYKTDAEKHWKECSCGDTIEKATHTFTEWTVIKEASTTEKGSKERNCSVCGYQEIEEISMKKENSPQTGDGRMLCFWLALMIVSFTGVVEIVFKKKRL